MSEFIEGFIRDLRRHGLRIPPAERIDASKAALAVGVDSRGAFKAALRGTLAKSLQEARLFEEVFEAYFAPPRPALQPRRGEPGGTGGAGAAGRGAGSGSPPRRHEPSKPRERSCPPRHLRSAEKSREPRGPTAARRDGRKGGRAGTSPRLVTAERSPTGRADRALEAREGRSGGAASEVRRRDLALRITSEEEALLAREIPDLIMEVRLRRGRRYAEGSRGRLWVKKMIRESLAHAGVPFTLPMKARRPRSPRVVMLVDVSHSVARSAGLFLLICAGLAERIRKFQVLLFVDRVIEATDLIRRWASAGRGLGREAGARFDRSAMAPARAARTGRGAPGAGIVPTRGGRSFADLLASLTEINLAAPSDYGRAFFQARSHLARSAGRDAVLVVLGDARCNYRDPLEWAFEEIAARCRRAIWLNPEPRGLWDTADSVMSVYFPACDVVCEARDLDGLSRGVREILRCV